MFTDTEVATRRVKWPLWTIHKLLLTMAYGFILFMHHSKWREKLPRESCSLACDPVMSLFYLFLGRSLVLSYQIESRQKLVLKCMCVENSHVAGLK